MNITSNNVNRTSVEHYEQLVKNEDEGYLPNYRVRIATASNNSIPQVDRENWISGNAASVTVSPQERNQNNAATNHFYQSLKEKFDERVLNFAYPFQQKEDHIISGRPLGLSQVKNTLEIARKLQNIIDPIKKSNTPPSQDVIEKALRVEYTNHIAQEAKAAEARNRTGIFSLRPSTEEAIVTGVTAVPSMAGLGIIGVYTALHPVAMLASSGAVIASGSVVMAVLAGIAAAVTASETLYTALSGLSHTFKEDKLKLDHLREAQSAAQQAKVELEKLVSFPTLLGKVAELTMAEFQAKKIIEENKSFFENSSQKLQKLEPHINEFLKKEKEELEKSVEKKYPFSLDSRKVRPSSEPPRSSEEGQLLRERMASEVNGYEKNFEELEDPSSILENRKVRPSSEPPRSSEEGQLLRERMASEVNGYELDSDEESEEDEEGTWRTVEGLAPDKILEAIHSLENGLINLNNLELAHVGFENNREIPKFTEIQETIIKSAEILGNSKLNHDLVDLLKIHSESLTRVTNFLKATESVADSRSLALTNINNIKAVDPSGGRLPKITVTKNDGAKITIDPYMTKNPYNEKETVTPQKANEIYLDALIEQQLLLQK